MFAPLPGDHDVSHPVTSPDLSARGLLDALPDPLRDTASHSNDIESTGLMLGAIPLGSRVLDVGCGTGSLSHLVKMVRGATVIGVESDPDRAESTKGRGIDVHHAIWDEPTQQKVGMFDAVLFADGSVLHALWPL